MKVQVNEKEQKPKYPYLGILESLNLIVFFIDEDRGFVVNENEHYYLGQFLSICEDEGFKPLKGSITISND